MNNLFKVLMAKLVKAFLALLFLSLVMVVSLFFRGLLTLMKNAGAVMMQKVRSSMTRSEKDEQGVISK